MPNPATTLLLELGNGDHLCDMHCGGESGCQASSTKVHPSLYDPKRCLDRLEASNIDAQASFDIHVVAMLAASRLRLLLLITISMAVFDHLRYSYSYLVSSQFPTSLPLPLMMNQVILVLYLIFRDLV